ncbi:hypothetical protein [Pikeienuella sp. HZG-20]|uniref:hypothetical protein n=1 Tax=Paludibacillus litoralis TaxID=3133267 RepID=UPI0030EDF733
MTKLIREFGAVAWAAFCALALFSCAAGTGSAPNEEIGDHARLATAAAPPAVLVADESEVAAAADVADAVAIHIAAAPGARMVEISAIPWLRASPEGAAFIGSAFPRAAARGAPPESCPAAAASVMAAPPATTRSGAAAAALNLCLAQLERRHAPETCGCRVVALDDALLAAQEDFVFAPGVSALMIGPDGARRLVAETLPPIAGAELVSLRDARGEVARLALRDDAAEMVLGDGARYSGVRRPFGYRRGRLTERLALTGPANETMTILIGVEARDVFPD